MSDKNSRPNHVRSLLERINSTLTSASVLITLASLYFLLFVVAEALIGSRSILWLIVGPVLVIPVLALLFTAWELRAELLEVGWVATLVEALKSVRNLTALVTLAALFREIVRSEADSVTGIWQGIGDFFWRIIAG